MRHKTKPDAIVQVYSGQGEIIFPRGGRIQSRFELTEYATGQVLLTCTGVFPQASYRGWEQLVHHYRLGPSLSRTQAEQQGLIESYEGCSAENRQLTIARMLLVHAEASGVDEAILRLQMQFDCADVCLWP